MFCQLWNRLPRSLLWNRVNSIVQPLNSISLIQLRWSTWGTHINSYRQTDTHTHTHTHTEYVLLIAFPWQQWVHKHTTVLHLYIHCLSCSKLTLFLKFCRCLDETGWDIQQATYVFTELNKQGTIPAEAFIKWISVYLVRKLCQDTWKDYLSGSCWCIIVTMGGFEVIKSW